MSSRDHFAGAEAFFPARLSMTALRSAAAGCRGCDLYRNATQTVFGEGLRRARLMLIGEMPGDKEDLAGEPFVGPAGRLLDEVLQEAEIERSDAYVTNMVKHFRWAPSSGKRRLHKTPSARQVGACVPWLNAEIELVRPEVVVCLGATAAKALLGPEFRVSVQHGQLVDTTLARYATATMHPSAVLRMRTREAREQARQGLLEDMQGVGRLLRGDTPTR